MNHTQWTPEVQATWKKLESFQLNKNNNAVFNFSARLAKENGWSRAYTARVIQEYKRFLLLAVHAGHPVCPSEAVDQGWHLHLVYTRSYWQHLCTEVLGRPLHHEPTAGGLDESAKFHLQYEDTLASYRRLFGAEPPADIWPTAEECFKPKLNRWVDVSRHWTLPKPAFLRCPWHRLVVPFAAALVMVVTLAGCRDLNVFDYRGEAFLKFYITGFVLALMLSWMITRSARSERQERLSDEKLTDPYEIAFLGGGGRRMVDAALAALFTRGLLKVEAPKNGRGKIGAAPVEKVADLHLVEHQVWQALPQNSLAEIRDVRKALIPVTLGMQETLAARGYVFAPAQLIRLGWLAALPLLGMMMVGMVKFCVGLSHGRPVLYLFFCLVSSLVVLVLRLSWIKKRTAAGEGVWQRLEGRRISPLVERDGRHELDPALAAMAVAVGGTGVLSTPAYQPMHDAIHRQATASSGGCGSGGCGTSSGGGCGSGCGGGGCGGCGGGD